MARTSVLITGSSTGIGEACTARLAGAGWNVDAGVRREADGERLAATHAGDIEPLIVDVCETASIDAVIDHITDAGTGPDALVNNAGIGGGGPLEVLDVEDWRVSGFLAEANAKAIEPDKVAEAVEHALTSKRPKARYLVGTDAKVQAKLALLPDRAREFAMIKNGKKIRSGGA